MREQGWGLGPHGGSGEAETEDLQRMASETGEGGLREWGALGGTNVRVTKGESSPLQGGVLHYRLSQGQDKATRVVSLRGMA